MNNKNHSFDDIYFKHFLKSSHCSKIDITNLLTLILTNVGMILIGFIIFSIMSSEIVSKKLNAYDEDNRSPAITSANNNQHTNTSYSTTNITTTEKFQDTTAADICNTESTTSVVIEEFYGVVNTKKDPLNMRSFPSIESDILTKIPKGTTIVIISEESDWFKVRYSNIEGYVSKQYILLGDDNIEIEENNSRNTLIGIVITEKDSLNVRTSPSIDSHKIGTVPKGSQVSIIAENGDWYEIEYNNSTGFVSKKYIRLQD